MPHRVIFESFSAAMGGRFCGCRRCLRAYSYDKQMDTPTFPSPLALELADGVQVVIASGALRLAPATISGPLYYRVDASRFNYQHRNFPLADVASVSRFSGDVEAALEGNGLWLGAVLGEGAPQIEGVSAGPAPRRQTASGRTVNARRPVELGEGARVRVTVHATGTVYEAMVQALVAGRSTERDRFFLRMDRGESMVLARGAATFEVLS
jgi:hypothetical protein